jgi:hypothetical protein
MKKYHVVLKRVVNIVVDNVEADSPKEALDEAVRQFTDAALVPKGHNHTAVDHDFRWLGIPIDDGEELTAALVDEYDEDPDKVGYVKELVFDVKKDGSFKNRPTKL